MGIQINGNTNNINAGIGSLSIEDINELDIVGVATASNFKTGTSNVHSTGYECTNVNASGIITAAQFSGSGASLTSIPAGQLTGALPAIDGSNLTGVSGLGTALGTGLLSNIFYFNKTLTVTSNTSVNSPASASTAYTHFAEVELADGVELTIEDGDSLIIDVLGLVPS